MTLHSLPLASSHIPLQKGEVCDFILPTRDRPLMKGLKRGQCNLFFAISAEKEKRSQRQTK